MQKLITWVEIPAVDIDRAVEFYNSVFNLHLTKQDFGQEKMACFPNDEGAISYAPHFKPSKDGALVSFAAPDNVEATLLRIQSKGGSIVQPRTKIEAEGRDYFAICSDSEGNNIGIYGK
jgi:uncharacterized protein